MPYGEVQVPLSVFGSNESASAAPKDIFSEFVGIEDDEPDDDAPAAVAAAFNADDRAEISPTSEVAVPSRAFGLSSTPCRVLHSATSVRVAVAPGAPGSDARLGACDCEAVDGAGAGAGATGGKVDGVDPSDVVNPADDADKEGAPAKVGVIPIAKLLPTAPSDGFVRV